MILYLNRASHGGQRARELDERAITSCLDKSPFVVIATVGPEGLDCSPRGDPPGFVRVRDRKRVLIPDRRGNNRLDTPTPVEMDGFHLQFADVLVTAPTAGRLNRRVRLRPNAPVAAKKAGQA